MTVNKNISVVVLKTFSTYSEAAVCCNMLQAYGIAAFLSNESTTVFGNIFGPVNGVRLNVNAEDVETALALMKNNGEELPNE